jgi:hypothetical protein
MPKYPNQFCLSLEQADADKLRRIADAEERTPAALVRILVRKALRERAGA